MQGADGSLALKGTSIERISVISCPWPWIQRVQYPYQETQSGQSLQDNLVSRPNMVLSIGNVDGLGDDSLHEPV